MKIAMIGAGYVGLVSSVCFAELSHEVIIVDTISALRSMSFPRHARVGERLGGNWRKGL